MIIQLQPTVKCTHIIHHDTFYSRLLFFTSFPLAYKDISFFRQTYLAEITSPISYIPAGLPAKNLAASMAPFANTDFE